MSESDEIERVLTELVVRVRLGDGLGPDSVRRASEAIDRAGIRWRKGEAITRREAAVLIAVYPDLEAVSWSYPETEKHEIQRAAMELNQQILDALAAPDVSPRS